MNKLILFIVILGLALLPKIISSQNESQLLESFEDTTILTQDLEESECEGEPCIPKCCEPGTLLIFDYVQNQTYCNVSSNGSANLTPFRPNVFTRPDEKFDLNLPVYYQMTKKVNYCRSYYHSRRKVRKYSDYFFPECFQVMGNGSLNYLGTDKTWVNVLFSNYCVDGLEIRDTDEQANGYKIFLGREEDYGIRICGEEAEEEEYEIVTTYAAGYLVAGFFMLLTCIAYLLTWKEHKLQGWNTLSHSATMLLMYVFLAVDYFVVQDTNILRTTTCKTIGIFAHFFFLSNFCWLTTICFGLFVRFRTLNLSSPYENLKKKFLANGFFGWGLPFLFVMVSVILNEYYSVDPCTQALIPYYGDYRCSIGERALGIYEYYPITFLLALNLVFFGVTSFNLYKMKKGGEFARENLNKNDMKLFWILLKLFCVMGFTWSFEIMGWLSTAKETQWFWLGLDMVNCLQAVLIFIIHVGKPNMLASLKGQFFYCKSIVWKYTTTTTNGSANCASQNDFSHRPKK